jgi:hypothetical protein
MRFGVGRSSLRAAVLGAAALLAGAGCDWRKFADEAEKAPVRSIRAPGGFKEKVFGRVLLPLSDGLGSAAAFVSTSINDTNVAVVKINMAGGVSNTVISLGSLMAVDESSITALAEVPGTITATSGPRLLLGVPRLKNDDPFGESFTYLLPEGPAQPLNPPQADNGVGRGVLAGPITTAGTNDYVIGSDAGLHLLAGGSTTGSMFGAGAAGCDLAFDINVDNKYKLQRPLRLAKLWAPADPVFQVVSGNPRLTGMGSVSIFASTAGGPVTCVGKIAGMEPLFGQSLAVGDFNNDGQPDLLVGAPPRNAYVYLGPFPDGLTRTPLAIQAPAGEDFGYAVLALNIDDQPGDEMLIGDPKATVEGAAEAGRVAVYTLGGAGTPSELPSFADLSPEGDGHYGYSVHALRFCTDQPGCADSAAARVLLVGAENEVYLYFRVGDGIPLRDRGGKMVRDVRGP